MITIDIKKPFNKLINKGFIEKKAFDILKILGIDQTSDLSILIGSDLILQELNLIYRGIDQPTDVLSFDSNYVDPETGKIVLGEIALSYESTKRQALEANHPVENELLLLLIHGILHLSGYDHNTKNNKQIMWLKQQSILNSLGIKLNRISDEEKFHD